MKYAPVYKNLTILRILNLQLPWNKKKKTRSSSAELQCWCAGGVRRGTAECGLARKVAENIIEKKVICLQCTGVQERF